MKTTLVAVVAAAFLTGCATVKPGAMRGVFVPSFAPSVTLAVAK